MQQCKEEEKEKQKVREEKRKLAKAKFERDNASGDEDDATEPAATNWTSSSAQSQFASNGAKAKKARH